MTPLENTRLFGHYAAQAQLLADLAAGRLPHGIIISGPHGTGKATLAYRFARMLLSGEPSMEIEPDHPSFRRMLAGSHADLLVIEPVFDEKKGEAAREISVDQARGVAEFLSLTPGESDWRVVIIDSIDQLNNAAANAILKILEEPPPQAVLLLISHNPGRLLPTIRSRCRMLKCAPLDQTDFGRAMRYALPEAGEDELAALGLLGGFAPGVAVEYAGQGALELYEQLLDLLADAKLDTIALHALAEQIGGTKSHGRWEMFARLMLTLLARTAKYASGVALAPILPRESEVLARLASLHAPGFWAQKWQQSFEQFSLAQHRHLDYKQMVIVFFHSLDSKEMLVSL